MLRAYLRPKKRGILLLLCAIIGIIALAGYGLNKRSAKIFTYGTYVFGTEVQLVIIERSAAKAKNASKRVFDRFNELHQTLHTWQPSEITRLNEAIAAKETFQASPRLAQMLRESRDLSIKSEGIFDPGISALVALWGFQSETFGQSNPPEDKTIAALLKNPPTITALTISDENLVNSVNPLVKIDFGGYAKGWALDEAAQLLKAEGIDNALIDIGGDIIVLGNKLGAPWTIGIRYPRKPGILASIALYDGEAIATSGDYYRYFTADNIRYSHIIDPRTGKPAKLSQSSSVLIEKAQHAGATADGASKIPFIVGPLETARIINKMDIEHVLLIDQKGEVWITQKMNKRLHFYDQKLTIHFIEQ